MKSIIKTITVLTVTCISCGFLLAFVNALTKEPIAANQRQKIENGILELSPSTTKIEKMTVQDSEVYKLFDKKKNMIGYAVVAIGNGYQGKIKMIAVINPSFDTLEGIKIIESSETPGLGAKINENFFLKQFKALKMASPIECVKEKVAGDNEILAISGATISSRSVVNIINQGILSLKDKIK